MSKRAKDVRKELIAIGDKAKANYDETNSLNAAKIAVEAYRAATKTAVAQIRYKQLTSNPTEIKFLEE